MEQVQHYASVDARKYLGSGVAGESYKPVCCVDRTFSLLLRGVNINNDPLPGVSG